MEETRLAAPVPDSVPEPEVPVVQQAAAEKCVVEELVIEEPDVEPPLATELAEEVRGENHQSLLQ